MQTGLRINYLCATFDHLYIISPSLSGIGLCRVDYRDDNLPAVMLWKQKYAKKVCGTGRAVPNFQSGSQILCECHYLLEIYQIYYTGEGDSDEDPDLMNEGFVVQTRLKTDIYFFFYFDYNQPISRAIIYRRLQLIEVSSIVVTMLGQLYVATNSTTLQ